MKMTTKQKTAAANEAKIRKARLKELRANLNHARVMRTNWIWKKANAKTRDEKSLAASLVRSWELTIREREARLRDAEAA